ncbi:MAG: hypothetical protein AAFQ41_02480 [Cyanobacteria bacterium J06623_7]
MKNYTLTTLAFSLLLLPTILLATKSQAQGTQMAQICADENARSSYGFSREKCQEYLQQSTINNEAIIERAIADASYYRDIERYMLEAIVLEDSLPLFETAGYHELYTRADRRIDVIASHCDRLTRLVNVSKRNQANNTFMGIMQLSQGYQPNHRRNFDDQLQHEMLMQEYNHQCSDLEEY